MNHFLSLFLSLGNNPAKKFGEKTKVKVENMIKALIALSKQFWVIERKNKTEKWCHKKCRT